MVMIATHETDDRGKMHLEIVMSPQEVAEEMKFIGREIMEPNSSGQNINDYRALVMERYAEKAFRKKKVMPATRVLFMTKSDLVEGEEYSFLAVFMPKPTLTLSSYEPVKISDCAIDITEEHIQSLIDEMRQEHKSLVLQGSDVPVGKSSSVEFAIETTRDGEDYTPLWAKRRLYRLEDDFLPEAFDEQLIGMVPGETKTIEFTMQYVPEESEDERPVDTTFISTVTVHGVYEETLPEVDDAWVKYTFMDLRTVEELRAFVRKKLTAEQEAILDETKRHQIVSALAQRLEGSIPDTLFEAKFTEFHQAFEEQIKESGSTLEEYLKEEKVDPGQFRMESMLKIREQLKQAFALDAYAEHHAIDAAPEDYESFFREINPEASHIVRQDFELNGRMYIADEGARRIAAMKHLESRALAS